MRWTAPTWLLINLALSLCIAFKAGAAQRAISDSKNESVRFLRDLRNANFNRLQDIQDSINKRMTEGSLRSLESDVLSLKATQQEHLLRIEFLNRLINQVDGHFGGGDLRAFLERELPKMATTEVLSTNGDRSLWKFMRYAADAIHRIPERNENVLAFLEGYMNRSITNPVDPKDYLNMRNYTNGAKSEAGAPLSREDVGAFADRRLQENPTLNVDASTTAPATIKTH